VRWPLDALGIVLSLLLLVLIVVFGAIVDLAYRRRRSGAGYFASGECPRSKIKYSAARVELLKAGSSRKTSSLPRGAPAGDHGGARRQAIISVELRVDLVREMLVDLRVRAIKKGTANAP
jgi:hypothetical protein